MADKALVVLCVHGLGDHRESDWEERWSSASRGAFPAVNGQTLEFKYVTYDDIFAGTDSSFFESAAALWELAKSGASSITRRQKGILSGISDQIKWTAGYVVAWVKNEEFKTESRKRVLEAVRIHKPDIILAHSLGSLITYDAFSHRDAEDPEVRRLLSRAKYITFGSQIGNPFVVGNLTNGRVQSIGVNFWHHLYNVNDNVFTAEIRLWDMPNFRQIETPFDDPGIANHAAESYLRHPATIENVWRPISENAVSAKSIIAMGAKAAKKGAQRVKTQKALLVGINDYPNAGDRLEGCVNDVFTMSSVLQECGFLPESIRTCLDGRATAEGILDRLKWLLDDPKPGDELIFYYSGHGARVPEYGNDFEPDHHLETLVPWDFDWSPEKMISDDQIFSLYSQLPHDCRLVMIFDCCHSGGIHRNGGQKARGITPPDDVRHRELKWDSKTKMWVSRDFTRINKDFSTKKSDAVKFFGRNGATRRLGRASTLRTLSEKDYDKLKKGRSEKELAALGPYLPVIIEACGEEQLSYEYRHGATSHGAFTYCLAQNLRTDTSVTFEGLVDKVKKQLEELQYEQVPKILGPTRILSSKVPWKV